jgi:L-asparagine oxygenase
MSNADASRPATLTISDSVRDAIMKRLLALPDPEGLVDEVSPQLYRAFAELPDDALRTVLDFGRHTDMPGVLLVDNLPVDPELPPTPADGGPCREKKTFVAEGVLLGLSGLLGEPVSFLTEKDGRIVHDVTPTAAGAATQTSQGSVVDLNFHNDIVHDAAGRYDISNPDFLVLHCLRPDQKREALTVYADGRDLLRVLDTDVVEVLRSPLFRLNAPGGYTRMFAAGRQVLSEPVPIVSGPAEAPEIAVAANGVVFLSGEAEVAFKSLQAACVDPRVEQVVRLDRGQALLINNRKGIHARSQFAAQFRGEDRWLQRTYVRRSLWNIRDRAVAGARRLHR